MRRRALIGTIATLGAVAVVGLFAALAVLFSSPDLVHAQTNNAPEFATETATRSVDENAAAFSNIGAPVAATDSDDNERLVYTLENAHTSSFTIVRDSGQLQVGQPLDYEDDDEHTVKVVVTDRDGATDTITVTITVNNVEEDGKVSLTWTRPQVGAAITASLTDPDGNIAGLTWQWAKSSNRSNWSDISSATSATYTPAANDGYLRATASYTDGKGSGNKTAQAITSTSVQAAPSPNSDPVITPSISGGYGCGRSGFTGVTADLCLYIPRYTPAGDDLYYPAHVTDSDHHEWRYTLEGNDGASFRIDPTRGTLYTTEAHIYDGGTFEITIKVTDPSGGSDSIDVGLKSSGGANPPVVTGPSHITYPENGTWPLASYSATIKAHMEPETTYSYIGWIIAVEPGGGDGDFFDIDDDGNLTFTQPPDYENPADYPGQNQETGDNRYSFSLHVYETNPPQPRPQNWRPSSTFFSVTVVVTDETVEALEIDGPSAVRYPENGTDPVATYSLLRANDDVDDWVLSGADADQFDIDDTTGELTFKRAPDFEKPTDVAEENTYRVTITAYAGTQSKTEFVFIRVTDVNERPEFDEGETATREVEPDAEVSDLVGDPVKATDPDKNAGLTYSLEATPAPPFQIDQWTGQISVSGAIDSTRASYTMTVFVTDGADADGNSDTTADDRITVTVNVEGASNNAPEFPSAAVTFTIDENTSTVQDVGTPVTATDDDSDTLSYTLEGADAGFFTIGSSSGQIQTKASQNYDYETKPSYSVTVKADDDNGGTATKAVTINLNNVDEDGTVTLSTNAPSARAAITATLTDPDKGITGTSWQWTKSSDGNTGWTVVGTNSSSYTPLDADLNNYLRAIASYTDGHGQNKTAQAQTTQQVGAGTNRAPEFGDLTATREVAENTAANDNVGAVVAATDADSDSLTYSLIGADATSFTIDGNGQIKVGSSTTLNFESAKKSYTVIVQVHDGKNANGGADTTIDDTIVVTIDVTDVNEAPEFNSATATRSIAENSLENATVGAPVTATDPDAGASLTYSLSGADASSFTIDNNGQIKVKTGTTLDHEATKNSYEVTVAVRDSLDSTGTADSATDDTIDVTINVTDVNEKPAFTDTDPAARNVPENTQAGEDIGNAIAATDPENDTLTYTLSGTNAADFDIVGTSGQLQTKSALDKETKDSYTVTVSVHDGKDAAGGPDTTVDDTITVNITVTEENDPPEFSGTTATREVAENPTVVTNVGAPLTATDDDTDDTLTYSLEGTDKDSFTIVTGTGQIQTKSGVTYNHEDKDSYSVIVKVIDSKGGTDTIAVTINVTNVNEEPAFDDQSPTTRSIAENTAANTNIGGVVGATDPDDGDTLTYSLGGTDAASFDIDTSNGQLKTKAALDKETKASYTVTVSVRDSKADDGTADSVTDATITVNITVTDANDAPTFAAGAVTLTVAENSEADVDVGSPVTATDLDTGNTLTYTLEGTDKDSFKVVSDGQIQTKSGVIYDFETKDTYSVTVKADDGNNGGTATKVVTITLTNVDEDGTVILSTNQPTARAAITATLTDPDKGITDTSWQWAKSSNGNAPWTNVEADSSSYTPPDDDLNNYLRATASYGDGHGQNKTAQAKTTQKVQAGTNRVPEFGPLTATREVAENTAASGNVGAVVAATDLDTSDTLTYSLTGADASSFTVDNNGQIKVGTSTTLDYESNKKNYTVIVQVHDNKDASGSTDTTIDDIIVVTINVTDVEETGTVSFSTTQPAARARITATVTDPDGGVTGTTWVWGACRCSGGHLYPHQRGNISHLHAGRRRFGQVPEGQGDLH